MGVGGAWVGQLCVAMVTDPVFHMHRVLKKQLVSKFKHLNLMDSQVKDVKVS